MIGQITGVEIPTCELCGSSVKVIGKTTQHYEPIAYLSGIGRQPDDCDDKPQEPTGIRFDLDASDKASEDPMIACPPCFIDGSRWQHSELLPLIESLQKENARLRNGEISFCGYCGKEFTVGSIGWNDLQTHITTCEKHPVAKANERIKKLRDYMKNIVDMKYVKCWECSGGEGHFDEAKEALDADDKMAGAK